jgi:uncharacterized protein
MISRPFWLQRITAAWERAPLVWLTGVRRVGKTTLARQLPDATYLNCDLPSTAEKLVDPESFFGNVRTRIVVLDEIHQLPDPSRILKIGTDAFPNLRILATGSSTLAASTKFRDALTGRKRAVHLCPVLYRECSDFGAADIEGRLLRGGLPGSLLATTPDPGFFSEWLDSFYARDIQELFRVAKRGAFITLTELLLRNGGGIVDITKMSKLTGITRPTVMTYLDVLQATHVITLVRPYHGGSRAEIIRQPKAYGFDTGFVCHYRGWNELRPEDRGVLWEHVVLETLQTIVDDREIHYWREKEGHEVDFVLAHRGRRRCDAIECKWNPQAFSPASLLRLRILHPAGLNFVVCPGLGEPYRRKVEGLEITFCDLSQLETLVQTPSG